MRTQVAIFVDAGYMFALGSIALSGSALPRMRVGVNIDSLQESVKRVVRDVAGGKPIVRTYWYDNSTSNRFMSNEQLKIGEIDGIKLRLVALHQQNLKTGAASAIARDVIELSSKGSISDALIFARNDMLRTAIEIAQSFGVRAHILEIFPEETSQFSFVKFDVDTLTSWTSTDLKKILFEQDTPPEAEFHGPAMGRHSVGGSEGRHLIRLRNTSVPPETEEKINNVVGAFIEELFEDELEQCMEFWRTGRGVPNTYDKSLLIECRNSLERNLTDAERQVMRSSFREKVEARFRDESFPDDEDEDLDFDDDDESFDDSDTDSLYNR